MELDHDKMGRVIAGNSIDKEWAFKQTWDDRGNKLTYEDSSCYWEESTYNDADQLLTMVSSGGGFETNIYNEVGNLLSHTNHMNSTEYKYDKRGRKIFSKVQTAEGVTKLISWRKWFDDGSHKSCAIIGTRAKGKITFSK